MANWSSNSYERQFLSNLLTSIDNDALYPRYRAERDREETYWGSANSTSPTPHEFVKAGFFHLRGPDDCVCCFCCGLVLNNWNEQDIPLQEHARHRPDCLFVKLLADRSTAQPEGESLSDAITCNVLYCREYASRRPAIDGKHTKKDE